ncbi:hypothetical protein SDC9_140380 [bioreactor metagenome]|uniref:DUF4199 domain-containing protein n=1 Tax=bioreactor metagenome TaxID=1076179 RepID=A0A645DUQ2_9ZZZZ
MAISIILWIVKLVATVWLLYYFIREFSKPKEYFRYGDGLSYGVLVSFFSAIICAFYSILHYALLFPDSITTQMGQVIESIQSSGGDTSTYDALMPNMPYFISIGTLFYYTILGLIFSAIIANYTKKETFFFGNENQENNDQNQSI